MIAKTRARLFCVFFIPQGSLLTFSVLNSLSNREKSQTCFDFVHGLVANIPFFIAVVAAGPVLPAGSQGL